MRYPKGISSEGLISLEAKIIIGVRPERLSRN